MSDPIHLSLWFPTQTGTQILPRLLQALHFFPYSSDTPAIHALGVLPVNWSESPLIDERFVAPVAPEEAIAMIEEFVHDDYAYEVEVAWNLWQWEGGKWSYQPSRVGLTALGSEFADGIAREQGHLLFDLGSDELFLAEQVEWNDETRHKVQLNVAQLLALSTRLQAEMKPSARLLWSEDDGDLAKKLMARLQKVN